MTNKIFFFLLFLSQFICSQNLNLNEDNLIDKLRDLQILNKVELKHSLNQRPIASEVLDSAKFFFFKKAYSKPIFSLLNDNIKFKLLPVNYNLEFNNRYPIKVNNGSMIPNRGYQHIFSPGIYFKAGPLHVQLKPEYHFSENKKFEGFWKNHRESLWLRRYALWNLIDLPERFGENQHNEILFGQSSVKLKFKNYSLGISNENIWWGPSRFNSIMMSNNARGFKHITFNSESPLRTFIGNFEFQLISGKLENSGFLPSGSDVTYGGYPIFKEKINQIGETDDWRYLQAINLSYSPKWIDGLSFGFIRWVQYYSALIDDYRWMSGKTGYFPIFKNLFRKNDKNNSREMQTDQAAGIYFRFYEKKSKLEIYSEFHYNDSKVNLRDLFVDSRHSRAFSLGIQKGSINNFIFSWEWTKLEQTAGRLIRDAGSWYAHNYVYDGFTNNGEVIGASIGPGSNLQTFEIKKYSKKNTNKYLFGFQILDNDNDYYYKAFDSSNDFRRYWKDFNFYTEFEKSFKNFNLNIKCIYTKSLNYQWGLIDDNSPSYYQPGIDLDNFNITLNLIYFGF